MAEKLGTQELPSMGYALGLAQQMQAAPTVVSAQQTMRKRAQAKPAGAETNARLAGSAVKDATAKDTMPRKPNQEGQSKLKANYPKAKCATQAKVEATGMEQNKAEKDANKEDEQCAKKRTNKKNAGESDHHGKRLKPEMDLPSVPDPYTEENELLPEAARVPQALRSGRHSYTLSCPSHLGTLAGKITVLPGAQRRLRCVAWGCGACMCISQRHGRGTARQAKPTTLHHTSMVSRALRFAQQGLLRQAQFER
jgi:hypothetical protein